VSQPPGYFTHSLLSKTQKIPGDKQTNPKKMKKRGYRKMEWQKSPQNHKPCHKRMPNNGEREGWNQTQQQN
jgi:hypothetical protein